MNSTEMFDRLIGDFLPPRIFDAHAHLYRVDQLGDAVFPLVTDGPAVMDFDAWRAAHHQSEGGLFFAYPTSTMDMGAANQFIWDEVAVQNTSRALMMIRPEDDPAAVDAQVCDHGYAGFKVYHSFASLDNTQDATIDQFLPDWAWEIADQRGLLIMLHMVRSRSLADPVNANYIVDHCRKYPGAKLVLAHAARGFASHHTAEGIESLRGLDNVFFDTSVVCEPLPLCAILKTFGSSRLMYGSDFPVSQWRGRPFTIGDGFFWVYENTLDWSAWPMGEPTLTGIESLHAIKQAAQLMDMTDSDIERIFHDNVISLLAPISCAK
jgi:glutamate-1-semialdehyde 2,1-aminomutase